MIIYPPTPAFIPRKRKYVVFGPPGVALNLVAASFDDEVTTLTMQFDRAINIASIHVAAITVGTIITGNLYQGDGAATLVDPNTVQVPLTVIGEYDPTNSMMFATAGSGILAVDDGGMWAGTSGTYLPLP